MEAVSIRRGARGSITRTIHCRRIVVLIATTYGVATSQPPRPLDVAACAFRSERQASHPRATSYVACDDVRSRHAVTHPAPTLAIGVWELDANPFLADTMRLYGMGETDHFEVDVESLAPFAFASEPRARRATCSARSAVSGCAASPNPTTKRASSSTAVVST